LVTTGIDILRQRRRIAAISALALAFIVSWHSVVDAHELRVLTAGGAARVAIIKSLDLPEYNLAYEGFVNQLTETGHNIIPLSYVLARGDSANEVLMKAVHSASPDLILALGTRAAREAQKHLSHVPIIYSMVLTPPDNASAETASSMTGATLTIPLSVQVDELKRAFPTLKRIGIISDPSRTQALADSAARLCHKRGLIAHVGWARGEGEVPDAVRALKDSIEILWMIPDETVLTPRSSRFIIFELIKSGVPVIGLSSAYVKAGALMSLDCNYTDICRQSAELAVRVLAGQKPGQLPFTIPRTYTRSLNLKIMEHVRIQMDPEVMKDSNAVTF
jgi:ABC-type uncharacterized transport system substrate-binding protein